MLTSLGLVVEIWRCDSLSFDEGQHLRITADDGFLRVGERMSSERSIYLNLQNDKMAVWI